MEYKIIEISTNTHGRIMKNSGRIFINESIFMANYKPIKTMLPSLKTIH